MLPKLKHLVLDIHVFMILIVNVIVLDFVFINNDYKLKILTLKVFLHLQNRWDEQVSSVLKCHSILICMQNLQKIKSTLTIYSINKYVNVTTK